MNPSLIDIPRQRRDETVEVYARAFAGDPLMRHLFPDHGPENLDPLRALFCLAYEFRRIRNEPLKGILENDRLVGAAAIALPDPTETPVELDAVLAAFERSVGAEAAARLRRYGEIGDAHRLDPPHLYLVCLAVHPEAQGRGYGRMLLEETQRLSESHPTSTGVALDTENPANVALYEHVGYHVVSQDHIDNIPIWYLFRPNRPGVR